MKTVWLCGSGAMGTFFYHKYKLDRAQITKEAMVNALSDNSFRNVAKMQCCQTIKGVTPNKAKVCVDNTYKELQSEIEDIDQWLISSTWNQLLTFPDLPHETMVRRFHQ